ncbi:glycoside-pentoside-hexuronide (GPH):cation symporter [Brachybacterium subflavum]|uniref:glycoside-pentoside-hexuronide (GPH):cation symporter n=1 Tax=Brachybacterium subflavum TaxID=2585206 RepID=UPI00187AC384
MTQPQPAGPADPSAQALRAARPDPRAAMERLPFRKVFAYGAGDAGCNTAFAFAGNFLPLYFITVLGLPASVVATISLVVLIWDAFADVIAGRIVDSTMTRWGKFRPFILFGSLPLMIMTVLLFTIPHMGSQGLTAVVAAVIYAVWGFVYSMVNIPYGSLAPAITQVAEDRGKLGAARTYGGQIITLLLVLVISPQINQHQGDADALQHSITVSALGFLVLGMALFMITFFGVRERVFRETPKLTVRQSLRVIRTNRPLAFLCASSVIFLGGMYGMQAVAAFFTSFVLGDATLFIWLTLAGVVANLVAAPFAPKIIASIGKRRGYLVGCAAFVVGGIIMLVLGHVLAFALIGYFLINLGVGLNNTLMWALEGDTVEYGEWKNDDRAEGATYSLFSFARKMSQAVGRYLALSFIALFGFMEGSDAVATATNTSDHVRLGLSLVMGGLPILMGILAAIVMKFYPIDEKTFATMVEELHERREAEGASAGAGGSAA